MFLMVTLMLVITTLVISIIKIKDVYGKILSIGVITMFIIKMIGNLLMNLNLGLKADFSMPFVSYGITYLIIDMMCLGLILSIYRRKDILSAKPSEKPIRNWIKNTVNIYL